MSIYSLLHHLINIINILVTLLGRRALGQAKALRHTKEDINTVIHTTKHVLARTHGKHRDISQRVHTLVVLNRKSTIEQDTALAVAGVDIVV